MKNESSEEEDQENDDNFHFDTDYIPDKKPIKNKYIRHYGLVSLVLFGAGNTIGAGIFAYTGLGA